MLLLALILLVIITGALGAYAGRVQAATLWAGKMIAGREFEKQMPTGFQDAITLKSQDRRNTVFPVLLIAVVILPTFLLAWYAGLLALVATIFVYTIAGKFIPDNLEHYVIKIAAAMANREADYLKVNDLLRADAAHDMLESLEQLLLDIHGQDIKVPAIREIKRM